eukprot:CAMPEP_0185756046 /NCGR_PEP_ID=MMETSP1174-20130828/14501_1 /TAXON_ID=35687 /ORGANISM="Dictyocha speculum, Strain CCMP1381" /LENGTH=178 /DNA_ID=CAMNT_0028434839 /DNA_START=177 /DNA_END=713 /DNA_ORIENTATION=-
MIEAGGVFERRTSFFTKKRVVLVLRGSSLICKPSDSGGDDDAEVFDLSTIAGVEAAGSEKRDLILRSSLEVDIILELVASSSIVCQRWERAVNEAIADMTEDVEVVGVKSSSAQSGASKAVYFAKKKLELRKKKQAAEAMKAKYLKKSGGGMKYTALAMANRGTRDDGSKERDEGVEF